MRLHRKDGAPINEPRNPDYPAVPAIPYPDPHCPSRTDSEQMVLSQVSIISFSAWDTELCPLVLSGGGNGEAGDEQA